MRPHPRIRKTIKWGGAGAAVLFLGAWIASIWLCLVWIFWAPLIPGKVHIVIRDGIVFLIHTTRPDDLRPDSLEPGLRVWKGDPEMPFNWGFDYYASTYEQIVVIPLWCPAMISLAVFAFVWRLDGRGARRIRRGHCPTCNYNLSGLPPGAPCPECGAHSRCDCQS